MLPLYRSGLWSFKGPPCPVCNRPLGLQDFHGAVLRALENIEQEGREPLAQEELRQGLRELPAICDLHQGILENLEQRLGDW